MSVTAVLLFTGCGIGGLNKKALLMKYINKILTLFAALFLATVSYAQQPASVEKAVKEIVKKYDDNNGVSCVTVAKGSGLEMLKMVFNKEFGKEFMKGVTSITIID